MVVVVGPNKVLMSRQSLCVNPRGFAQHDVVSHVILGHNHTDGSELTPLCHDWCVNCPKPITTHWCVSLSPSVVIPLLFH